MRREPFVPKPAKPVAVARATRSELRVKLRAALKSTREALVADRLEASAAAAQRPPRWRPSRGLAPVGGSPPHHAEAEGPAEASEVSASEPDVTCHAEPFAEPLPLQMPAEQPPPDLLPPVDAIEPSPEATAEQAAPIEPQPPEAPAPAADNLARSRLIPRWRPRRRTGPIATITSSGPAPVPPTLPHAAAQAVTAADSDASVFAGLLNDLPFEPQATSDDAEAVEPDVSQAEVFMAEAAPAPPEPEVPADVPVVDVEPADAAAAPVEAGHVEDCAVAATPAPLIDEAPPVSAVPDAEDTAPPAPTPTPQPPPAPLALLGPGMMARLKLLGFDTFEDLACVEPAALRHALGDISRLLNVEAWVVEARRQVAARHGIGLT